MWSRDQAGKITDFNQEYQKIIGSSQGDDKNGLNNHDIELYQHDHPRFSTGKYNIRKHIIESGKRQLYDILEYGVSNQNITIGAAININEVDQLKKEIRLNLESQKELMESSISAIAIYGSDKNLKYYNNNFILLWDLDESYLADNPSYSNFLETLREKNNLPEQADFKEFRRNNIAMFTQVIERHEEVYFLPNNKVVRLVILPSPDGGLIFTYTDITDQITLERSYNTLMSVRNQTLDNLSEGVVVFGADAKLQLYNPIYAKIWGLETKMLDKKPHISEVVEAAKKLYLDNEKQSWESHKQDIISVINSRSSKLKRFELTDGRVISRNSMPLADGAILLTYTDISDSAKVEASLRAERAALQQADKIKNDFLSNVSYKLRSPLTSIMGFTEMLLSQYAGKINDKQQEYIKDIYSSSNQLSLLIDNILDLTSIDANKVVLNIVEIDIYKEIQKIPAKIEEYKKRYNANITIDCPEDIGFMMGDKKRIKRIIINLIRNACRFVDKGGNVKLSVTDHDNDMIYITVEDDGRGIAEDQLPHIFSRFNQASNNSQSSGGPIDAGLGLAVAKSFVHLHDGDMSVSSKFGEGTKVVCKFKRIIN